jgi:Lon protease-like protein
MVEQKKIEFDTLPETLPVFPLEGVLLLPRGNLPLHIFEPRYIAMVDDSIAAHRIIGIAQPKQKIGEFGPDLYKTCCAGKITSFEETQDGRYYINLTGICRFDIKEEVAKKNGYRVASVEWQNFENDLEPVGCLDIDRSRLRGLLENYFNKNNLSCEWDIIDSAADEKLITCLSMICPFTAQEKQALLEAECCKQRAQMFMTMLEMASDLSDNSKRPCH